MQREMRRADKTARAATGFDLKALRLATHGWLLGNPLVYKPGAADLDGIARELARAGSTSGTLILGEAGGAADEMARAILILRLTMSRAALGDAAAAAIAQVAHETFGYSCAITGQWDVALRGEAGAATVARISVDEEDGVMFLGLRLAFDALWEAGRGAGGQPQSPLLARPDWREVFLARTLHALDIRLAAGV